MAKNVTQSAASVFLSAFADETQSQQRTVPVDQIVLHQNNTAAKNDTSEEIRELADSIEANGLIHPLAVNCIGDNQYRLISGERRYRAVTEHLDWTEVPCTVYHDLSPAMEQLILVNANLQTREYTAADKLELYIQADAALRELKASGKYKGGIQRGVAAMLNVSEQQVGKYKAIVAAYPSEQLTTIKSIDAAATAVRQEKAKTESYFQFLEGETLLEILDMIYGIPATVQYYQSQMPTPKEAAQHLKSSHRGGCTRLKDGTWFNYDCSSKGIRIGMDGGEITVKYSEADLAIRDAISRGLWSASPADPSTPETEAVSVPLDNIQLPYVADFTTLAPISNAVHSLRMAVTPEGRCFQKEKDVQRILNIIQSISEEIKELQADIMIHSTAAKEDRR